MDGLPAVGSRDFISNVLEPQTEEQSEVAASRGRACVKESDLLPLETRELLAIDKMSHLTIVKEMQVEY